MLKRHEVDVLRKAGHPKTEVAGLTGVSLRSVYRLAEELPVEHVDDAAERVKRGIGRPSRVENFRKLVTEILFSASYVERLLQRTLVFQFQEAKP